MERFNELTSRTDVARSLAEAIKTAIDTKSTGLSGRIPKATLATSYALHIALEAVAKDLEVDPAWFKTQCGVGQPLAYFI